LIQATTQSILCVIPAFNEASSIAAVIHGARNFCEVLVVDDGSTDRTINLASQSGAEVVQHPRNLGKGAALQTGFRWALAKGHPGAITLDADGQHDPADIPNFLQAHERDAADLIIGQRNWRNAPFPRRYTNPFGSRLLSLAIGIPVPDSQSGFRLYNRLSMETLDLSSPGFELETEVIVQAARTGLRLGWVPIRTIYGVGETSNFHPWHDSLGFLRTLWRAVQARGSSSTHPRAL
jgi:glycosyltransferase involved in cell wall biosynthesis